jgi:hypothetical protein
MLIGGATAIAITLTLPVLIFGRRALRVWMIGAAVIALAATSVLFNYFRNTASRSPRTTVARLRRPTRYFR